MKKHEILKKYFGYASFREGQELLIDNILNGKDAVGIMPTGAGKSICFQVPALLLEGITLVISPLISLMKDQVNSLTQAGIKAAYINTSLTYNQYNIVLERAKRLEYKIIYVAPERLLAPDFISFAQDINISLVTIDEAHCVSAWGQDFRPSYLKIPQFIESLSRRPIVAAFTATATELVKNDMIALLHLEQPYVLTTGFDRKNLFFEVRKPKDKSLALQAYLEKNKSKSGIIYCSTRKTVEEVCATLCEKGYSCTRYHAGLTDTERKENQDSFIYDKHQIMVATNAFGMGIDKSNVHFVLHYNMPKNIESYYQEAGRAGRDGEPAHCLLFYSGQDVITNQFLIEKANENEEMDEKTAEEIKARQRELLKKMTFYCHTNDCLREYILKYFGSRSSNYCGNCANCNNNFDAQDITIEAQKIMSCIKRSGERFGIIMIMDSLRGSKNIKVLNSTLSKISTYGIMADCSEKKLRSIINFLIEKDYLAVTNDEFPKVMLSSKSSDVLFGREKLEMKIAKAQEIIIDKPKEKVNRAVDAGLLSRLKALRNKIAAAQHVPSYIVFADAALSDMCVKLPKTKEDFLEVSGVGQMKLDKYGNAFLSEINSFLNDDFFAQSKVEQENRRSN